MTLSLSITELKPTYWHFRFQSLQSTVELLFTHGTFLTIDQRRGTRRQRHWERFSDLVTHFTIPDKKERNLNHDIKGEGATWTAFAFLVMFLRSALLLCETVLNEQLQSQPEEKQIVWSLCWRPISLRPNKAWKWRHFQQQCWHKRARGKVAFNHVFGYLKKKLTLTMQRLGKKRTINEHDN